VIAPDQLSARGQFKKGCFPPGRRRAGVDVGRCAMSHTRRLLRHITPLDRGGVTLTFIKHLTMFMAHAMWGWLVRLVRLGTPKRPPPSGCRGTVGVDAKCNALARPTSLPPATADDGTPCRPRTQNNIIHAYGGPRSTCPRRREAAVRCNAWLGVLLGQLGGPERFLSGRQLLGVRWCQTAEERVVPDAAAGIRTVHPAVLGEHRQ
jgi:hypothetical protein